MNCLRTGFLQWAIQFKYPLKCFNKQLFLRNTCLLFLAVCCSVQFSHSVMSNYLQPYGLQHARLPCLSPTSRACSNWCPSSRWYHPTISSSVISFSYLQSFPAESNLSWVSSSYQVAKVLEFQLQHQSFQWIFRTDFL